MFVAFGSVEKLCMWRGLGINIEILNRNDADEF